MLADLHGRAHERVAFDSEASELSQAHHGVREDADVDQGGEEPDGERERERESGGT